MSKICKITLSADVFTTKQNLRKHSTVQWKNFPFNIFFFSDTTSMNPQFHIQIPRSPSLSKCHVVVSVTQQYETNTVDTKKRKKRKLHHIGFAVYEVPPHMTRLTPLYVAEHVRQNHFHTSKNFILHKYFWNILATSGCDKSLSGKRSGDLFYFAPGWLHCRTSNQCAKLWWQIFAQNFDWRTIQHLGSQWRQCAVQKCLGRVWRKLQICKLI